MATKNATLKAKRREDPESNWELFDVKILTSCGMFMKYFFVNELEKVFFLDDYETAVRKGITAQETSDLSSSKENVRKRKPNSKYRRCDNRLSSSESDKSSEVSSENMPTFPKILKRSQVSKYHIGFFMIIIIICYNTE